MRHGPLVGTAAFALLAAGLMSAAAYLAHLREARYPLRAVEDQTLYVTSEPALRRLSAGFTALAADLYWIRAIQYYGGLKLRSSAAAPNGAARGVPETPDYKLLYPLLDLTTSLDPEFNIAYRF